MRTTMFAVCLFVFSAYFERKCTKIFDFHKISSKIVTGLFIMGFSHFLHAIFHFLGPAVVPPTTGPQTSILSRNLRLGSKTTKNRSSNMQIIEKHSGPRTTCFLDPGATSAIEIGGEKGDQTKASPSSCVPVL